LKESQGIYSFGDLDQPWLQLAAGYFPFKYNPQASNLGEYLYRSGKTFHLMDNNTYEEMQIDESRIGDAAPLLKENTDLEGEFLNGELVGLTPPTFVELNVEWTEPGIRGDTSKSAMKPATLETGATVQVPLFVNTGDRVRIDTRKGAYVSRV